MRPGLSFRVFERRWRRPVGRCISSEPRFTECGAGLSSQRIRPVTGFAEQSNLALDFCNSGLHRRKCSLRSPMTRRCATRETHPAARARSMQHCYPHRRLAPNIARLRFFAEYFPLLRGDRRFRGEGSATRWPPKSPVLSQAVQRCRRFAACLPQARKIPRIEVKCLNAGADRSVTRQWPGPLSASRRTKSARVAAVAWPWTISASIAT